MSIGLPVYNGAETIQHALDSILGQTFTDLEVLVCDNASEDATLEIARGYESRDPRVRVYTTERNMGARANFNRAFELSSGEFFKWAAHDDWLAPTFIERCIEELEASPDAVLCYTSMCRPDAQGKTKRLVHRAAPIARSEQAHVRFGDALRAVPYFAIFGLYRSSALGRTQLLPNCPEPDFMALAEAALLGQFRQVEEVLFFARSPKGGPYRDVWVWLDPSNAGRRRARAARVVRHLLATIGAVDIPATQKTLAAARIPFPFITQSVKGKFRRIQREHGRAYSGSADDLRSDELDDFIEAWRRISAASHRLATEGVQLGIAGDPLAPRELQLWAR